MIQLDAMPAKFDELAEYNRLMHHTEMVPAPEVAPDAFRIVPAPLVEPDAFTEEHHDRMRRLQGEYRAWLYGQYRGAGYDVLIQPQHGTLLVFPPYRFRRPPWHVRLGLWWRGLS